jgi:hypothetical protein
MNCSIYDHGDYSPRRNACDTATDGSAAVRVIPGERKQILVQFIDRTKGFFDGGLSVR